MEINITSLVSEDMFQFSHSRAEGGQNAGEDTWNAALNGPRPLLDSPEALEAMRDWARDSGGWEEEEILAWDDNELQALFLQLIAGDCRECPALEGGRADSLDGIDWEAYYADENSSGRLIKSGNEIFYYLGM